MNLRDGWKIFKNHLTEPSLWFTKCEIITVLHKQIGIRMKKLKKYINERDWVRLEITLDMFMGRYFFLSESTKLKKSPLKWKKEKNSILPMAKTFWEPKLFWGGTYHEPSVYNNFQCVYPFTSIWPDGKQPLICERAICLFRYVRCYFPFPDYGTNIPSVIETTKSSFLLTYIRTSHWLER